MRKVLKEDLKELTDRGSMADRNRQLVPDSVEPGQRKRYAPVTTAHSAESWHDSDRWAVCRKWTIVVRDLVQHLWPVPTDCVPPYRPQRIG